jgi:hypothetical protein
MKRRTFSLYLTPRKKYLFAAARKTTTDAGSRP